MKESDIRNLVEERNLLRTHKAMEAEFELAQKSFEKEQRARGKRIFLKKLDFTSYVHGFADGANWTNRGYEFRERAEKQ